MDIWSKLHSLYTWYMAFKYSWVLIYKEIFKIQYILPKTLSSSPPTSCTSSRSSTWFTFISITCCTGSFFFKLNILLRSVNRIHKFNFHIYKYILSFYLTLSSHSKETIKISKHFLLVSSLLSLFKKVSYVKF